MDFDFVQSGDWDLIMVYVCMVVFRTSKPISRWCNPPTHHKLFLDLSFQKQQNRITRQWTAFLLHKKLNLARYCILRIACQLMFVTSIEFLVHQEHGYEIPPLEQTYAIALCKYNQLYMMCTCFYILCLDLIQSFKSSLVRNRTTASDHNKLMCWIHIR